MIKPRTPWFVWVRVVSIIVAAISAVFLPVGGAGGGWGVAIGMAGFMAAALAEADDAHRRGSD